MYGFIVLLKYKIFDVMWFNIIWSKELYRSTHDVQFSCAINQLLLAHHWRVHQSLLKSRFIAPPIPWGVSAPGGKMRKQLLKYHNFLNKSPIFIIESSTFNIFAFQKALHTIHFRLKIVLDLVKVLGTIILWQDVGPCCEQTHAAFEVRLSLDQGQGVYRGWSDVYGSSQLRPFRTCIIDIMHVPGSIVVVRSLQWRHNGRNNVSNHQTHDCLPNGLFRRISKKTSKLRVTGLWAGNSPGTGEFPTQMASNTANVSTWWRHHVTSHSPHPSGFFHRYLIRWLRASEAT